MPTNVVMSEMNVSSEQDEEEDRRRKRKCCEENCLVHQHACTEILLRPEILTNINHQGSRGLSSSTNPLLEFCLDGGFGCKQNRKFNPPPSTASSENTRTSFLLFHCSNSGNLDPEKLETVCQTDSCDINVQNFRGFSALHFIIKGCSKSSFPRVLKCLRVLIDRRIDVNLFDTDGNTALHCLNGLLTKGLIEESVALGSLLLKSGCDPNKVNAEGRSILSYAVFLPETEEFVRLLLDFGARVWPKRCSSDDSSPVERIIREREQSAFTWFLKSIIRYGEIRPGQEKILNLLCHSMADEEDDPRKMKKKILSTMVYFGRSFRFLGPVFFSLKRAMCPFWTRPQPLKFLCKRKIRKTIGAKRIPLGISCLKLPQSLQEYLELQKSEF